MESIEKQKRTLDAFNEWSTSKWKLDARLELYKLLTGQEYVFLKNVDHDIVKNQEVMIPF